MSALKRIVKSDMTNASKDKSSRHFLAGVGGKVVALAVLPVILMAALNVFSTNQSLSVFDSSLERRDEADAAREAIVRANDDVKSEMLYLVQKTSVLLKVHQNSLLMQNSGLTGQTAEARAKVREEIGLFQESVQKLSAALERAGMVRANADAEGETELQAERAAPHQHYQACRTDTVAFVRNVYRFERADAGVDQSRRLRCGAGELHIRRNPAQGYRRCESGEDLRQSGKSLRGHRGVLSGVA